MKRANRQTDMELEYNIRDCISAISAYPESKNTERYLQELRCCEAEQARRAKIRSLRNMIHHPLFCFSRISFDNGSADNDVRIGWSKLKVLKGT